MTLSTPRLRLLFLRRVSVPAGLGLLVVLLLCYQLLSIPREDVSSVNGNEDPENEPDDTPKATTYTHREIPKFNRSTNGTSGRRPCNPPTFLSYDQLEELMKATGGAARGRLIHHSWKTKSLPPRFERYSSTWCECFNAWPQVLWTDADNARFVRDKFAWFHDVFREFAVPINSLDTLRYMYLAEYGGLYTDLDNICLRPFEHLLHGFGIVLGDMTAGQYKNRPFHFVQNSMIFSRPGHPFWLLLVESLRGQQRRHDVIGSRHMMDVLHTVWDQYNSGSAARTALVPLPSPDASISTAPVAPNNPANAEAQVLAVGVYAGHVFNPVSYFAPRVSPCRSLNDMSDAQLHECVAFHKRDRDTYVLQVHTQSWGGGKQAVNRNH